MICRMEVSGAVGTLGGTPVRAHLHPRACRAVQPEVSGRSAALQGSAHGAQGARPRLSAPPAFAATVARRRRASRGRLQPVASSGSSFSPFPWRESDYYRVILQMVSGVRAAPLV